MSLRPLRMSARMTTMRWIKNSFGLERASGGNPRKKPRRRRKRKLNHENPTPNRMKFSERRLTAVQRLYHVGRVAKTK
jgi:hypothetical protein